MKRFLCVTVGLALVGCAERGSAPSTPDVTLDGNLIRQHTVELSSDAFLGRGPGQPGEDIAAAYISGRFADYGLEPVSGSYYQPVPMLGYVTDAASVSLSFSGPDRSMTAPYLDGFVLNPGDPRTPDVSGSAEVVFVGYGVDAPENDWNDFAGVDVRGKFILILVNDPPATTEEPGLFGGRAMTYYGRWSYKWEEAARRGALGALIVHEAEPAGYPWSVVRGGRSGEQFSLPPDPAAPAPAGMVGWVTRDVAAGILGLAGLDYETLKAAAGARGFVAVPTGVTASASLHATVRNVETKNIVGLLRGSERLDEIITITSHYDHFGVGEAIDGDSIYNGAYDNASGTALLMELARTFGSLPEAPARSILFIATAAEEQGLLGSQWYVQSPLFPLNATVAEINVDAVNLWGETDDVVVHGEERSALGAFVRPRAAELGLEIKPDAEPEKGFFFRSDHFPFAKAGVPSLYVEHGRQYRDRPEGWGQAIQDEYTAQRYHAPSDEFLDDFVFEGATQQGLLVFRTAWDIAQDNTWPGWNDGQEFKAARDAMMGGR